jgi:hypothetical protein
LGGEFIYEVRDQKVAQQGPAGAFCADFSLSLQNTEMTDGNGSCFGANNDYLVNNVRITTGNNAPEENN